MTNQLNTQLEYSLSLNDFLQYQLYTASKSERVKKQRRKSWIIVSFCVIFLMFYLYEKSEINILSIYFAIIIFLIVVFYPLYLSYYYKSHYDKYVKDSFKNRVDKIAVIKFNENYIETFDETGEFKINYTNLEEINEIKDYIFLKLKTDESLIFPKSKIENIDLLKNELIKISKKYDLKQNIDLNWKWK